MSLQINSTKRTYLQKEGTMFYPFPLFIFAPEKRFR